MPEKPPYRPTIKLGEAPRGADEKDIEELPDSAIEQLPDEEEDTSDAPTVIMPREVLKIAAEQRTGLAEEAARQSRVATEPESRAALDTEGKGGDPAKALDKIFEFERKKIETLLATGEYAVEDFIADIEEDLEQKQLELTVVLPEEQAERDGLEKDIAIAKRKLEFLKTLQK